MTIRGTSICCTTRWTIGFLAGCPIDWSEMISICCCEIIFMRNINFLGIRHFMMRAPITMPIGRGARFYSLLTDKSLTLWFFQKTWLWILLRRQDRPVYSIAFHSDFALLAELPDAFDVLLVSEYQAFRSFSFIPFCVMDLVRSCDLVTKDRRNFFRRLA